MPEISHKPLVQPSSKKSLVFVTSAPGDTLGDPSAAGKLIKRLLENKPDIEVSIIIEVGNEKVEQVKKLMPPGIKVITTPGLNFEDEGIKNVIDNSNGVVFYPTFHFFGDHTLTPLKNRLKPTLVITEYNLSKTNMETQNEKLRLWMNALNTGLGPDCLGIFCNEENVTREEPALGLINDKGDIAFRDFLLTDSTQPVESGQLTQKESDYQQSHELFFAYYNKMNRECNNKQVNPISFIRACLTVASPDKDVDIVLPLLYEKEQADFQGKDKKYKTIEEFKQYVERNPSLFSDYTIEITKKTQEGKLESVETIGNGKKKLRIINPFPVAPTTIDKLLNASNPFAMGTGDQSTSEIVSKGKVFLYQAMSWKEGFLRGLIAEAANVLGETSELVAFYRMQLPNDKDIDSNCQEIAEYLKKNEATLHQQMKQFSQHIMHNKNLNNLPDTILKLIDNPNEFIRNSFKEGKDVRWEDIITLLSIFPHQQAEVLSHIMKRKEEFVDYLLSNTTTFEPQDLEIVFKLCGDNNLFSQKEIERLFNIALGLIDNSMENTGTLKAIKESSFARQTKFLVGQHEISMHDFLEKLESINKMAPRIDNKFFFEESGLSETFEQDCLADLEQSLSDEISTVSSELKTLQEKEDSNEVKEEIKELEDKIKFLEKLQSELPQDLKNYLDLSADFIPRIEQIREQKVRQLLGHPSEINLSLFTIEYDRVSRQFNLVPQKVKDRDFGDSYTFDLSHYETEINAFFQHIGLPNVNFKKLTKVGDEDDVHYVIDTKDITPAFKEQRKLIKFSTTTTGKEKDKDKVQADNNISQTLDAKTKPRG